MNVSFRARIKDINHKNLVSGDKSTRLVIEIDHPSLDIKNRINQIDEEQEIGVVLTDGKD
jgi:hypothetical protein